jgi:hypothetical protein
MKLASFSAQGRDSYGTVIEGGIVDLGRRLGERYPTLRAAIAGGALGRFAGEVKTTKPDFSLAQVTLLPPITDPDKIICAGRNTAPTRPRREAPRRKTRRCFCGSSTPWSRTISRWCAPKSPAISIMRASWP